MRDLSFLFTLVAACQFVAHRVGYSMFTQVVVVADKSGVLSRPLVPLSSQSLTIL
jgi:hypothetical protein